MVSGCPFWPPDFLPEDVLPLYSFAFFWGGFSSEDGGSPAKKCQEVI